MIKKDKIKIIIRNLIETKNNKKKFNFFFYDTFKKLNQIIKKKGVVIFYGDQVLTKFIKVFFYFLYSNVKFKKNCFLLFNPEKTLVIGHNIFPDWPGTYSKNNIFKNITVWTKNFIYIFIFKKRLMLIFIEIL
tara:strand:+ start:1018 stop:1416 length:399 start_codon:yes stop_codon:yes gene_type:complete